MSEAQIAAIRTGYSRAAVYESTAASLNGRFPPGTPYVNAILEMFYKPEGARMEPGHRERVLIALLAAQAAGSIDIAIHIYWGIAEGLPLDEVLDVLALTGMYGGIDRYADNLGVFANATAVLALAADLGKTDVGSVMAALGAAFSVPQGLMLKRATEVLVG